MEKINEVMSMSGDSCSTSSGCVSDLENLSSEDPSPDSPISLAESSHSLITNLALDSLPKDINHDIIIETILTTKDIEEVAEDELLEEELIESEIIIDCSLNDNLIPVVTENCYSLEIYNNGRNQCLSEFNSSFDCSSSISDSYKSETASIKSDTGDYVESDHKSLTSRPILNGVFLKEDNSSSNSCNSNNNSNGNSYYCKWTHCDWPGNYDDLVDHIREIHVELQPYQQQKHNWKEINIRNNAKNNLINRLNDRKITDNNSNNNYNNLSNSNINNHKKCETNAQQYVCLWEGCKVYGKGSLSRNWLERHVLEQHSGPRPFKCIVERCGARFKVQSALERHVNSHFKPNVDFSNTFNANVNCLEPSTSSNSQLMPSNCSSSDTQNAINSLTNNMNGLTPFELHLQQTSRATMMRCKIIDSNTTTCNGNHFCSHYLGSNNIINNNNNCNSNNGTPNKILKRKKSATKLRRKCVIVAKCSEDFFDECVMEKVRYDLIQLNARTGLDISGTQSTITFHSKVIARRENDSGVVNVLLKWEPNNILPDVWVSESEANKMESQTIPVSLLPQECLAQLIDTNGIDSKPKIKQRRK